MNWLPWELKHICARILIAWASFAVDIILDMSVRDRLLAIGSKALQESGVALPTRVHVYLNQHCKMRAVLIHSNRLCRA